MLKLFDSSLNQNPGFRLALIDPGFESENISSSLCEIKKVAEESERILITSETFTEFAKHYPEIKTYENFNYQSINLNNG